MEIKAEVKGLRLCKDMKVQCYDDVHVVYASVQWLLKLTYLKN